MDAADFERVYDCIQQFRFFFAPAFGYKQWRERSRNYRRALQEPAGEWHNAENLYESVGVPARAMQRFLTDALDRDPLRIQGWLPSCTCSEPWE